MKACKLSGVDASYCELNASYGHDSFLVETEQEGQLIGNFLKGVSNGNGEEPKHMATITSTGKPSLTGLPMVLPCWTSAAETANSSHT